MSKNKNGHGGRRKNSGRKPKSTEIELIERLDNIIESDAAIKQLGKLINRGNFNAIKLYLEYRFGKPKDSVDITSNGDSISFNELINFGGNNKS